MARFFRSIPAVLAALVLAAHFYRAAAVVPAVLCVAAIALVVVGRSWAVSALRLGLAVGSVIWIVTAWRIAQSRIEAGTPYVRMLVILGAVAVFTAFAGWVLPAARDASDSRRRFAPPPD